MKTPRVAPLTAIRLAALALLAAIALGTDARAQQKETPDAAGYVPLSQCTQCHKSAFPANAVSHGGHKICQPPARWISGGSSGSYCCGGTTSSHCPNDGLTPKKSTFDSFPGGSYISPGDASVIKKWVDNSTSSTKTKTPVVVKPKPKPVKKKPAAVAYWCDPATGKVVSGKAPKDGTKLAKKTDPCVKSSAAVSTTTVVAVASFPLVDPAETRWLTKVQAAAYSDARAASTGEAGHKAVDDQYRKIVKAQTRPEAASAYETAIAAPAVEVSTKIKAALDVEMWGGKNVSAVVGLYQEKASSGTAKLLEIQLTKADYDMLAKASPAALGAYKAARGGADGRGAGTDFKASLYDPVALRLSLVAAMKAINKEAPGGPKKEEPKKDGASTAGGGLLTDKEIAVLTPKELATYKSLLKAATINGKLNEKDPSLLKEAARLRGLIAKEHRLDAKPMPSSEDMTEAKFKDLPLYQKQQFCKDYRGANGSAAAKDTKSKELDNGSDAKKGLESSAPTVGSGKTGGKKSGASSSAWSKEDRIAACGKVPEDGPGAIDGDTHSNMTATVPAVPNDVDKDDEAKGKNKWLTEPLVISAVQGSLVGLLIGSLFGPLGLILGPIIGAVAFYGISKLKE